MQTVTATPAPSPLTTVSVTTTLKPAPAAATTSTMASATLAMTLRSKICQVRIWRGDSDHRCQYAGDCVPDCNKGCKIGCNNPARHKNPSYGKDPEPKFWWRNPYNYAEYLC